MSIDLSNLTVDAVQEGFADGAFNAEELTRACLAHVAEVNPHLNAIIFLNDNASKKRAPSTAAAYPASRSGRSPACPSSPRTR
jgi:Asp-tRNA(Asn)/Glu-tRNA(Gln) amidotransferase A subunit family amidase